MSNDGEVIISGQKELKLAPIVPDTFLSPDRTILPKALIKLKNNLRIHFLDDCVGYGYPADKKKEAGVALDRFLCYGNLEGRDLPDFYVPYDEEYPKTKLKADKEREEIMAAHNLLDMHFLQPFSALNFRHLDPFIFAHLPVRQQAEIFTLLTDPREFQKDGVVFRANLPGKGNDIAIKLFWESGVEWEFYDQMFKSMGLEANAISPESNLMGKVRHSLEKVRMDMLRRSLSKHLSATEAGLIDASEARAFSQAYSMARAHALYPDFVPPVHSVFTYGGKIVGFATPYIKGKSANFMDVRRQYPHYDDIGIDLSKKGLWIDPYGANLIVPADGRTPQMIDIDDYKIILQAL